LKIQIEAAAPALGKREEGSLNRYKKGVPVFFQIHPLADLCNHL